MRIDRIIFFSNNDDVGEYWIGMINDESMNRSVPNIMKLMYICRVSE